MNPGFWADRRVLVTGHTGFKGSWLALVLKSLGADATGFSLRPHTDPSLFDLAGVGERIRSVDGDVRDATAVRAVMEETRPEVVFHLAAQSLVRRSYEDPVETYGTNVMGTLHVLEAARRAGVAAAVIVTSDKCYENREWAWAYRENDALGGADPYSSSKGCAEILVDSYRRSFLASADNRTAVATARGGNVIGGGDFAADRLIPDLIRSFRAGETARLRNPTAVRPWQHVLDALSGYLLLAERLHERGAEHAEAWNFGPTADAARTVADVADRVLDLWPDGPKWERDEGPHPAESHHLTLDSAKARARLGWRPRWTADEAIDRTVRWYRDWAADGSGPEAAIQAVRSDLTEYGLTDPFPVHERAIPAV